MDDRSNESVLRLLRVLAERLEGYLEGDDLALEELGERLDEEGFGPEELHAAVLVLRSLGGFEAGAEGGQVEESPGKQAHRILSDEERGSLTTEAWGYLLDLRRRGSLDPDQFERVLDRLTGSGVRPVGVDQAREVATRVALDIDEETDPGDVPHGDFDVVH